MIPGYGAAPNMNNYDPALSAGVSSPGSASQQFDYNVSAIDPALEGVGPTTSSATATPATAASTAAPSYASSAYPTSSPGMPFSQDNPTRDVQNTKPFLQTW
jgi:hypothetical protein